MQLASAVRPNRVHNVPVARKKEVSNQASIDEEDKCVSCVNTDRLVSAFPVAMRREGYLLCCPSNALEVWVAEHKVS